MLLNKYYRQYSTAFPDPDQSAEKNSSLCRERLYRQADFYLPAGIHKGILHANLPSQIPVVGIKYFEFVTEYVNYRKQSLLS